jgi:hypothetical protein
MLKFGLGETNIQIKQTLMYYKYTKPGTVINIGEKLFIRTKDDDMFFVEKPPQYRLLDWLDMLKGWNWYFL